METKLFEKLSRIFAPAQDIDIRIEVNIHYSKHKNEFLYIYKAIKDRKLSKFVETAILNQLLLITENEDDVNISHYFECILTDLFTNEAKIYHLKKFNNE